MEDRLKLTAEIVAAYVSGNQLPASELPGFIKRVGEEIALLSGGATTSAPGVDKPSPAEIRKSITQEHLVCFEDGKKLRSMKRYLRTQYDMTPEQYRAKWGLPFDYPMVAPGYRELRSAFAKKAGLGRRPQGKRGRPMGKKDSDGPTTPKKG